MERLLKVVFVICELVFDLELLFGIIINSKRNKKFFVEDLFILFEKMRFLRLFKVYVNRVLFVFLGFLDNVVNNVDKFKFRDFIIWYSKCVLNRIICDFNNEE